MQGQIALGSGRPRIGEASRELAGHLRAGRRITLLLGLSLTAGAGALLARGLAPFAPRAGRRLHHSVSSAWARLAARAIGLRVRVEGAPPRVPSLLVANHLGYLDVVVLWTAAQGAFVAKSEVASWPLVGRLGALMQTLFIDRGRRRDVVRVLSEMERRLAAGESVILFAEATSTRGARVLPFKSSLFAAAARNDRPVACAALSYATPPGAPPAELAVCWWGDMSFAPHCYALLRLPAIHATLRFAPGALTGADRKALARAARERVLERFVPVAAEGAP